MLWESMGDPSYFHSCSAPVSYSWYKQRATVAAGRGIKPWQESIWWRIHPFVEDISFFIAESQIFFFSFLLPRSGLYCIFACASGGCSAGPPSLDYTVHFFKPLTCDEDDWWWAVRTVFVWVCICFCTRVCKSGLGFGRKIDLKSPNKYCFLSNLLETR